MHAVLVSSVVLSINTMQNILSVVAGDIISIWPVAVQAHREHKRARER